MKNQTNKPQPKEYIKQPDTIEISYLYETPTSDVHIDNKYIYKANKGLFFISKKQGKEIFLANFLPIIRERILIMSNKKKMYSVEYVFDIVRVNNEPLYNCSANDDDFVTTKWANTMKDEGLIISKESFAKKLIYLASMSYSFNNQTYKEIIIKHIINDSKT